MATQVTNYQCPACTGPLHFAGASGKLECEHCGSSFDVGVIEQIYADKERAAAEAARPQPEIPMGGGEWSEEEAARMRAYSCPSCGAELICDDTTAATSCPYCGNPSVIPGQFSGQLRPDCVIPFKLDKNAAVAALKQYYNKKKFLPKSFASGNHIEEIKGVYVPFWLFDGESDGHVNYRGTRVHTHRRGDEEITVTEHYRVARAGTVAFEKVPVDGSTKMPDAHMDAIEPFNYGDLKDFSTAYLPGYLADKYDQDAKECRNRAYVRIKNSTESALAATAVGYSTLTPETSTVRLNECKSQYALLPVWMLNTKWEGKDFLFAMNGQTGKLIGDLPVDRKKFWLWFFGISLPLMAALGAFLL